jgi:hypothetical protein
VACNRPAGETKPQDKLVDALSGASADAGSIPAASTFPANRNCGLEHLALALLKLEEGLRQIGRVELGVSGRRANVLVAEEKLRQP